MDENIDMGNEYHLALAKFKEAVGVCEPLENALVGAVPPRKLMRSLAESYFQVISQSLATDYSLSSRQKLVLDCVKTSHSQDFLYTLPIAGLGHVMSAREYRAVLNYRLMIPQFVEGMLCSACSRVEMDRFGDHAVQCKFDPGIKSRHDLVRDGLFDILRRAGISVRKEDPVSLSKEGTNNVLRPADVLIHNWINGKHACVDLTCCSPLVGIDKGAPDHNKAMRVQVKNKYMKHDGACEEAGLEFVPFGFTTFGNLCEEAAALMERVVKITHQHLVCHKSTKFVLHRLGFMIQKGIATQIVSRLPINFVDDCI